MSLLMVLTTILALLLAFVAYQLVLSPRFNELRHLPGPPVPRLFDTHLPSVLDPKVSSKVYEQLVNKYGRSIRIRGVGPWDERLLTLDPVSVSHVLKNSSIYQKPWQSRKIITGLIGLGLLSAEGAIHKRQRRVSTPAFGIQNMRALIPMVFGKGFQLMDRWKTLIELEGNTATEATTLDVFHWISRATFDVLGLAAFDYDFHSITDDQNVLCSAYKEMFEVSIAQGSVTRTLISVYLPILNTLFPDTTIKTVARCQDVINRLAGQLVLDRKRLVIEAEQKGSEYNGKDLLTLLIKANLSQEIAPEYRISDDDLLHNINTFMFAGSDTSSVTMTWTLFLLAQNPAIQTRLRDELLSISMPSSLKDLTDEEIQSFYDSLSALPFLDNVTKESLRLIPPVHSSLRVATETDVIPTEYPVHNPDGTCNENLRHVTIPKGSFVHLAIEGFNQDKGIWGEDAWEFNPDRWDNLPERAQQQPGLYSNILTFSAGPRSCIGMRFSIIEIKTVISVLLTNFVFSETDQRIIKANVVLTRPYVAGKFKAGSQLPLRVTPYIRE